MSQRVPTWFGALLFLVALAAPVASGAQTCWFTAAPDISFGNYDPTSPTPNDASGVFQFDCLNAGGGPSVRAEVLLSAGVGTFAQRRMEQGTARLNYNLYSDAALTSIFGDGTPPSVTVADVARQIDILIYGRIPIDQWVDAGPYADTITITINY